MSILDQFQKGKNRRQLANRRDSFPVRRVRPISYRQCMRRMQNWALQRNTARGKASVLREVPS